MLFWCWSTLGMIPFWTLFCDAKEPPIITIPDGQLRGIINHTIDENHTYYAYRGIPFAKPPIDKLRFAAPVKNDPWTGILDATRDKSQCVQMSSPTLVGGLNGQTVVGSEDCLYINVYVPGSTNGSLPVMVWIYGGGFNSGSSDYATYGPDFLLDKNVIYVAFNYRLGVFGFLSTEDTTASGNWGLKDQVLALKWVKDNIKYFGGDPQKITIFGESAGGASVGYLLQAAQANGLYHRAIMQSGSSLCLWALSRNAQAKAYALGLRLGIVTLSSKDLIDGLRKVDAKKLKVTESNLTNILFLTDDLLAGLPFGPVTEPVHEGAILTGKSWQLINEGRTSRVPILAGFNSNEAAVLEAYFDYVRPVLIEYDLTVARLAPYDLTSDNLRRLIAAAMIRQRYFGLASLTTQRTELTHFVSFDQFVRPLREHVTLWSKYADAYLYQFSYEGLLGDPNDSNKGVGHAEELYYIFQFPNRSTSSNQDKMVRQRMVTLWTNFAKTGNPTSSGGEGSLLGNIIWAPNNPASTNSTIRYMNINHSLTIDANPFEKDWAFYQRIYLKYGKPPYTTY